MLLAKAGDEAARARVMHGVERLCWAMAKHYQRATHLSREEMAQEARIATLSAIRRFNPRLGIPFHLYAVRWMRALILQLVINENPADARNRKHRVKTGRGQHVLASYRSLQEPLTESGLCVEDVVADGAAAVDDVLVDREQHAVVAAVVASLRGRERAVIESRLAGATLEETAGPLGLSRERVRQVERKIVAKLRARARARGAT